MAERLQSAAAGPPSVDSVEPRDPLLFFEPLPLEQLFWPLGFPVRVRTNSQIVLDAANASWGECRSRFDTKPIEIHAGVHGLEGGATPPMPVYRSLDYLLTGTATPHDSFVSDLRQGRSFGWVTPAAVADFAYYRYAFLEAMAYLPLAALHLAPIHCAAVEFDGQAVLLCGNSGAGKSSLSYACARRGWTYICDDAAYLVRKEQQPRVVGASFSIRLRDEARRLFPEIEAKVPTRRGNGAIRLELRTAELPNWKTAEQGTVRHIVFLDRQPEASPAVSPVSAEEAFECFTGSHTYGPAEMLEAWSAAYRHLVNSVPISRLTYSAFDPAIDRLEKLILDRSF